MLNPIECYSTDKFQYILIHKNGCSTTVETIKKNYNYNTLPYVTYDKPSFAIIRDPWERTLSGLTYDIQRTFGDVTEDILDSINFEQLFYQPINSLQRTTGYISHASVQIGYLFDVTPSFYVPIENLTHFLTIHFNKIVIQDNKSNVRLKTKLINILDKRQDIKDTIKKYIAVDRYFIDRIKNTEIIWDFTKGKMWQ